MQETTPKPSNRRSLLPAIIIVIIVAIAAVVFLMMNANNSQDAAPPPEPHALLEQVIFNLREVDTFRMLIDQTGAEYVFRVTLDQGQSEVVAVMRRAEAQYINPNVLFATTTLKLGGLPAIGIDIFAQGSDQWFKLAGSPWIQYPIAEGFDPGRLIQEDSGFPAALTALDSIEYIGAETLDTGVATQHIHGIAKGQVINDLMFGLLDVPAEEPVLVDVYVDIATTLPALLVVTLPNTATEQEPEDTQWRIEVYDINGAVTIAYPDGVQR